MLIKNLKYILNEAKDEFIYKKVDEDTYEVHFLGYNLGLIREFEEGWAFEGGEKLYSNKKEVSKGLALKKGFT